MWYLLSASLIWSLSFGVIGNLLAGIPPAWLAGVRLTIAAVVFLPFAKRVAPRLGFALAVIGAVQFGLMSLSYISSFRYLKSHEVALFTVMTPVYVTALSDLLCRRFHSANLFAAALAVAGAGLILWKGVQTPAPLAGFLLVELSNVCFAAGQIAYRELQRRQPAPLPDHSVFFWLYLGAFCAIAPFSASSVWGAVPHLSATQLTALLYLGVGVSGLAYFLWNSGARRVSSGVLAVANNLKIPFGIAFSILLFKERANTPTLLAGTLLVLAAFLPALLSPGRPSDCTCRTTADPVK